MSNRILKESICTSESIEQLTWFEEVLFYRLIVNCDDYGRFDGRIPILRARLFPLKTITDKTIVETINKLSTVGLVAPYHYDNKPILQIATWDKHQSVRNKRSEYPGINGEYDISATENLRLINENISKTDAVETVGNQLQTIEINCEQLNSIDFNCSSNPIQSESNPNTNPNPNPNTNPNPNPKDTVRARATSRPGFDEFWAAYPRKDGKKPAEIAYNQIDVPVEELLSAIERQKQSVQWRKEGGKYIPLPATWLHQRRWEDEGVKLDSQNDSYSNNDWQQFYQEGWQ